MAETAIALGDRGRPRAVADLMRASFAAAEGAGEGARIGDLARDLLAARGPDAALVVAAWAGETCRGALMLTPLVWPGTGAAIRLMAPVAVAPDAWRTGLGTRLIAAAQGTARARGFAALVTYGDPAYYGSHGFRPLDEGRVPAPYPLLMPQGWQGWVPDGAFPDTGPARPRAVPAFTDPALW